MNKIFKVVWSKTKECYVVVSEVAKNNGGKKKALSTVFAALVAAGAMMPGYVDAANNTSGGGVSTADASIAIGSGWANSAYANNNFSIAIGDQTHANGKAAIALGRQAKTDGEEASIAIGNETEATAKDSTAVGSGSKSSGEYAAALGFQTKATANYATAIGSGARGYAEDSQAIGREAETSAGATRAIAIGTLSKSSGNYATSLGSSAEATAERAIAVGYKSKAEAERAISVGNLANATKNDSIAVGNNSVASGLNASAVGKNSKASGQSAAAFGDTAQATNTNATAIGNQANASNTNTTAIGNNTVASGGNATAIGHLSQATGDGSVAVGTNNKADYEGAAVGLSNTVTGRTSAAFGRSNTVTGKESFAAGVRSTASGEHNVAIGYQAVTDNKATVAIGEGSKADIADGVALGSNSATTAAAGVQGFDPAYSRANRYGGLSGTAQTSTLGAVAVGNGPTATRQITGLAAGKEDTDAVNVAQLRSVNLKYAGNSGNSDVLLDDGTLNIKGEGLLSTKADTNGITVKLTEGGNITTDNTGKAVEPKKTDGTANNGVATTQNVVQAINESGWNVTSSNNGGTTNGSTTKKVSPGDTVTFSAGKNIVLDQNDKQFTYSLNKDVDLTKDGSLTIGDTKINNAGMTITGGPSITKTGIDAGSKKITNVTAGTADTDAVNVKQLKDTEKHIKPGTYAVANDGSVTLKYVDGNGTEQTETAKITGIAKKSKVINGQNTTVEEGTDTTDNSVTYKVNVKGDLADISSITNGTGSGKISFEGDQVVKVGGDHPISFDGKGGYVTGLQNKDWDITNPTVVSGRAATEDQLKKVSDGFNNTVKLTGNSGATGTQKLNQNGGLSFGVVGADNGKYITTTASGSNVVADLSTDAKNKLNSKVVVTGSGAATVAAPTVTTNPDGSTVTTYTVHVDPATATAASTESVVKKAVTGDTNIADVSVADGKATGDVGAKYEVSVSRNAVKDAAREAVTVNNGGNTDNPISVTPTQDNTNHNTTYAVTFDGNKAAKQIPLTYKATNGTTTTADQTVKLDKGLNFTGGDYTTASVGADGKVTFDVNLGTAPTVTDGKPGVPGQAGATGKDGIATVKTVVDTINNSGWKANAKANGGNLDGSATATVVKPGNTVNYAAGKNITVKQELETDGAGALTGNQTYTYSLNKDIDLTNAGSLTVGDTTVNNGGITIKAPTPAAGTTATTTDVKLTNTGLDNGGNKIVNVKDGDVSATSKDAVNGSQLHAVAAKERHIAPTTASHAAYTVDNNGDVTLDYVDGDGAATSEKAIIKGVAKQDLSNITNAGKQVITGLSNKVVAGDNITVDETEDTTTKQKTYKVNAKLAKLEDGTNTTVTGDGTTGNAYHVNVAGDLTGISSITNGGINNGKISFGPNKTVTVDGDHSITLNASTGTIGGLQNKTFDPTNITSGQAATEDQLKSVHDTLKANELHIAPTETNRTGEYTAGGVTGNTAAGAANKAYKYDATTKQVVLEYNDGTGANKTGTKAVIDFSALNTGAGASSWNIASDKVSTTEGTVAAGSAATQNIADGKTVTMKAGKNLTVKQENVGGNASVAFSLDKDLTNLDKVVVNGENGTNGKDGVTIIGPQGATGATGMPGTNGIDGKVGITGKDGKDAVSIAGKDGVGTIGLTGPQGPAGTNGKSVDISTENGTQTLVKPEANNNNQSQRIVYVPKDANGNPLKDDAGNTIKREVATMDDGLKFTGNNTVIENKQKLGSLVKVQGEGTKEGTTVINPTTGEKELVLSDGTTKFESAKDNIAVVADGADTLTVKLNKKLKGLDSVQTKTVELGDHTTPGGTTNITYNTGDNRIEYTTPGATPGTTGTKKVATTDDIWTIQGNGTDVKPVNGKVNVKAGDNVVITTPTTADGSMTINAVSPVVYTTPAGDKLTKKSDGKFYKADGSEYTGGDIIASFENPNANSIPAGKLNTTDGGMIVNNVGSAIKGLGSTGDNYLTKLDLANTATPNAAVNVSDLKNTADALKSNELHIRPTTSGRTGETVNKNTAGTAESYKYDAATKSVTLKYNDGTGAGVTGTEAKIDLSGLADQITSGYTFSTNAKGNLADGTTATATAVGNGKTVSFAAGKNLTVEQNIDATTGEHTYTYALSDKITAGKDGVNGKDGSVGVTGKDGSSVVINGADGSIGMTGPKGQDGKDGINGRDGANLSMTSAKGEQVLVNRDPAHNADTDKAERIVYVPKDASGNPIQDANGKNIVREVATMDDGLKFTGNNESIENKHKLGSLVKVQGEGVTENTTTNKLEANGEEFKSASGNIAVVADSIDKLTVKLNKNLAGINKISNGNSSITLNDTPNTTTPAVTISGGNLSMGDSTTKNKIVNLAPGTDDNDAVNVKQLKDAKTVLADGKNTKKSGTGTAADPYKVNVEGDLTEITSITNKADASGNAGKITFSPNQTVTVNGDHNITLDAGSGHIGGLTNLTFNPNSYTSGQAATEDQLKSVHDTLKANERHIAPTTVATGSTENKGGTANAGGTANVYKYDAASKTVTLTYNDGNGNAVTDTKAVIDLSNLSTGGTGASSWNVKSSANTTDGGAVDANHNANAQNIADGKSVEFQSGKNLVVKQTNDTANGNATVEFSLSDNITVGKDGANGKDGSVGAKGADGSAVVMNGKDGSIGLNGTNGANGISIKGKDGANGVGIDGKDGVTRIVYTEKVPDPANPGTTKEVTHEVATMDDGLKFTGNNTSTENKRKLGSLVKVQGEGTKESTAVDPATGKKYVVLSDGTTKFESAKDNIAVEADGTDTLTVKLNKNLKGLNSIQLGGNTIQSNGDNITFTTNGGNTKTVATTDQLWTIQANGTDVPAKDGKVNIKAGDHISITSNPTNGEMTISATGFGSMDGFNVKTSAESATVGTHAGDTTENIKNGKTVDMQAGKNLVVTQTNDGNGNTTVNYALNKDVDLGTNGSLKTGDTTINNDGFKNGNTTVGGNGMTIKDPTDPTKTVSLTKDGLNNGGNQITNVASGGNVDTNAANIGDIKRLAKDTRIKDGTYTVDNNGTVELTYVDGAGNQVKDASGNAITAKITGLTTLDSTRVNVAVNETGSGKAVGSTTPVKVTKGTEFVAGNNLIVERKAHTGNDLDNSVVYSLNSNLTGINSISNTAAGPKMTFGGNNVNFTGGDVKISDGNLNMNNNKITNVANGTDPHDAVNVSQLKAAKTVVQDDGVTTKVTKSTGANGEDVYTVKSLTGGGADLSNITNKVDQLGEEIGRVGAQGAALSALKPIQYDPLEPTQIMAGYGNYRGNSAVALGVAHYKNESTLIHGGVSWAGGSSHMMANAGVTWKVGNRDSEAAVADRYRKGPISSAYAMQQEMAAMKAQNAGLKGEVSDLKAENEQMKAQIAAMMAKLGL
ncbi:hypothetical protein DWZ94_04685 [Veillonella atypica]|uniref:ESPR-type extended signal peptide-containing protein n=1 Tax=Veillonella atypica TaxID=39777 RepID=UPI000E51F361|nr:ESPR-type extended signal peptide-containing protein [Veillonella atypica]RHL91346.1 hypothetical protein DWZ94_04685 [Veillonella atypica]